MSLDRELGERYGYPRRLFREVGPMDRNITEPLDEGVDLIRWRAALNNARGDRDPAEPLYRVADGR